MNLNQMTLDKLTKKWGDKFTKEYIIRRMVIK